jgi:exportin-T
LEPLDDSKRTFLVSLLEVILQKMKWDEASDPADIDEDDKAAFEGLRKVWNPGIDDLVC